jgi:hypothetical protein
MLPAPYPGEGVHPHFVYGILPSAGQSGQTSPIPHLSTGLHVFFLLSLLRTLVAFDTTSRHSNLELIDWVKQYLAAYGVACQLTLNDEGSKANLFARIGSVISRCLLSGHTDVVPVDGQAWTSPRSS